MRISGTPLPKKDKVLIPPLNQKMAILNPHNKKWHFWYPHTQKWHFQAHIPKNDICETSIPSFWFWHLTPPLIQKMANIWLKITPLPYKNGQNFDPSYKYDQHFTPPSLQKNHNKIILPKKTEFYPLYHKNAFSKPPLQIFHFQDSYSEISRAYHTKNAFLRHHLTKK